MKNGKQFVIVIHTVGDIVIQTTNKSKEVEAWCKSYNETEQAVELIIYQRNGLGYEQVVREYKRCIGF